MLIRFLKAFVYYPIALPIGVALGLLFLVYILFYWIITGDADTPADQTEPILRKIYLLNENL